jgi:hypothetical protein
VTDTPDGNLDDRLARLAARRSAAGAPTPTRVRAKKKPHPAAASRILVAGLSTSAFLSIIAALGSQAPASGTTKTAVATAPPRVRTTEGTLAPRRADATTTPTTIVVKVRRHVVLVDPQGKPIATVPATSALAHAGTPSTNAFSSPSTRAAFNAPASSAPVFAPTPTPAPPPPAGTPAPKPTPAPTPPPTTATPPTTVFKPPPPPPPPPCTGTKC